jgi:YHS domain-containing protein
MSRRTPEPFGAARAAILVASLLGVSACANQPSGAEPLPAAAAVPMTTAGPWRASTIDGDDKVMLEGHDAVAYFTMNNAVRGRKEHALVHLGVTWYFSSAAHREAFAREPDRYMPQFGGYCSNGINYAIPGGGGGGPNSWRIYRGRLYVFGGQAARDHFEMDTELNLRRAHAYWTRDIAGRNATLTRQRFMASRVPHYESDAALQARWESMLAAKTLPVMPGQPQVVPQN